MATSVVPGMSGSLGDFYPLVMETLGGWNEEGVRNIKNSWPATRATSGFLPWFKHPPPGIPAFVHHTVDGKCDNVCGLDAFQ